MTSGQRSHLPVVPETTYQRSLYIAPLRHKSPSLPVMRAPHMQNLNFHPLGLQPLNSFRAKLPTRPFAEKITESMDSLPRPLSIRKLRKSPSAPLGREFKQVHFPHQPLPQSKSFLGVAFPPQPKQRSSSTGVLLVDKNNSNTQNSGKQTLRRSSTTRTDKKRDLPGAGMAWLQRPRNFRQPSGVLNNGSHDPPASNTVEDHAPAPEIGFLTAPTHRSPVEPGSRNSSGNATAGSSYRTRSYGSTKVKVENLPDQIDAGLMQLGKRGFNLRRTSSTGANGPKKKVESKSPNLSAEPIEKVPSKGWKEKVFSRDFFSRVGGGANVSKKEAKTKTKDRSSSVSSTKTSTTMKAPEATKSLTDGGRSSPVKRVILPTSQSWCEAGTLRKPNDINRSKSHLNNDGNAGNFLGKGNKGNFNDSVLGIYEGSTGGITRTRLKKTGQWKPPMLQLQMEVVSETEKVPIAYPGLGENEKVTWVSIELDASIDGGSDGFQGSKVGLDVGILIDTSAYTSSVSFASMKLHAKKLVEAMETSRDRVAVMTFPGGSSVRPDTVKVLNSSGSVAKKQLIDDITTLTQNKWCDDPLSRNVRSAVQASIKKLKGMPLDTTRYGTRRHTHLFILTARLDDGEIELVPEVFFGEIQIHVIGIGPLFWPRSEMGASGWCVPTAPLGPRPLFEDKRLKNCKEKGDEVKKEISMEEIVHLLRTAVDLGVLYDVVIDLIPGENCAVRAVMGELKFPKFLPGEKRTLLVQINVGDISLPEVTNESDHETLPQWLLLERHLEATLGELQSRLLTVKATYRHANFPESTLLMTERHVEVSRFTEDSLWRFSPAGNRLVGKEDSPPISPMTARDYVKKVLIQRVASMHSNPTQAIRAVQEITNGAPTWGIDLTDICKELEYREKVERVFKDNRVSNDYLEYRTSFDTENKRDNYDLIWTGWDSDEAWISSPPVVPGGPIAISLPSLPLTPVAEDYRYRGSRELRNEDRAPFIAGVDSSPETEIPDDVEPQDEAQRIWLEMRLRQRGISSGSIKRRSMRSKIGSPIHVRPALDDRFGIKRGHGGILNPDHIPEYQAGDGSGENVRRPAENMGRSGNSIQDTLTSLVTLRDVRETDFGPWAM